MGNHPHRSKQQQVRHTPGPWRYRKWAQDDTEIAEMAKLGIQPTRILTNEGQAPIMAGDGDDVSRVALVDCQTKFKRSEGYKSECEIREANACLIAAAPELLVALKELDVAIGMAHMQQYDISIQSYIASCVRKARAAIAKAEAGR